MRQSLVLMVSKIYEIWVQQALDLVNRPPPGASDRGSLHECGGALLEGLSRTTVTISPSSGTENLPLNRFNSYSTRAGGATSGRTSNGLSGSKRR